MGPEKPKQPSWATPKAKEPETAKQEVPAKESAESNPEPKPESKPTMESTPEPEPAKESDVKATESEPEPTPEPTPEPVPVAKEEKEAVREATPKEADGPAVDEASMDFTGGYSNEVFTNDMPEFTNECEVPED